MVFNACSAPTHTPPPLSRPAGRKRGANSPIELCPSLGGGARARVWVGQSACRQLSRAGRSSTSTGPCWNLHIVWVTFNQFQSRPVNHLHSGDSFANGQSSIGLLAPLSTPAGVERGEGDRGGSNPDGGVKT